tara:strand:+ start:8646 stop:9443 length:798 start_codon:yes stop_codon:yes gene_type:complete
MAPKSKIISIEEWSFLATAHVRNFLSEQLSKLDYQIEFEDICKLWTDEDSEQYIHLVVRDELSDILEWSEQTDIAHPFVTKKIVEVPSKLNLYDLDDEISDIYSFDDLNIPLISTDDIKNRKYVLGNTKHPFMKLSDTHQPVKCVKTGRVLFTTKEVLSGEVFNAAFRDLMLHIPTLMDPVDMLIRQSLLEMVGKQRWWVIQVHRYADAIYLKSIEDYRILWYHEHHDGEKNKLKSLEGDEFLDDMVSDNPELDDVNRLILSQMN